MRKPTFIDYLRSGYSIGFTTAIDYTLSNGLPTNSSSLHFLGAQINEYEQSLLQVGSVIEPYDSDMLFPVYGFGGIPRYMGINTTSFCFPLTGNPAMDSVQGAQGIAAIYRNTLP